MDPIIGVVVGDWVYVALRKPEIARMKYILALDQGTTSSRAIVFDHGGAVVVAISSFVERT